MNTSIEINSAKFENVLFSILPSGYGHWKLTASFVTPNNSSVKHTITTSDSMLIDELRDEDNLEARQDAGDRVISSWIEEITEDEYEHYINSAELVD
jgi:hypothetical protein